MSATNPGAGSPRSDAFATPLPLAAPRTQPPRRRRHSTVDPPDTSGVPVISLRGVDRAGSSLGSSLGSSREGPSTPLLSFAPPKLTASRSQMNLALGASGGGSSGGGGGSASASEGSDTTSSNSNSSSSDTGDLDDTSAVYVPGLSARSPTDDWDNSNNSSNSSSAISPSTSSSSGISARSLSRNSASEITRHHHRSESCVPEGEGSSTSSGTACVGRARHRHRERERDREHVQASPRSPLGVEASPETPPEGAPLAGVDARHLCNAHVLVLTKSLVAELLAGQAPGSHMIWADSPQDGVHAEHRGAHNGSPSTSSPDDSPKARLSSSERVAGTTTSTTTKTTTSMEMTEEVLLPTRLFLSLKMKAGIWHEPLETPACVVQSSGRLTCFISTDSVMAFNTLKSATLPRFRDVIVSAIHDRNYIGQDFKKQEEINQELSFRRYIVYPCFCHRNIRFNFCKSVSSRAFDTLSLVLDFRGSALTLYRNDIASTFKVTSFQDVLTGFLSPLWPESLLFAPESEQTTECVNLELGIQRFLDGSLAFATTIAADDPLYHITSTVAQNPQQLAALMSSNLVARIINVACRAKHPLSNTYANFLIYIMSRSNRYRDEVNEALLAHLEHHPCCVAISRIVAIITFDSHFAPKSFKWYIRLLKVYELLLCETYGANVFNSSIFFEHVAQSSFKTVTAPLTDHNDPDHRGTLSCEPFAITPLQRLCLGDGDQGCPLSQQANTAGGTATTTTPFSVVHTTPCSISTTLYHQEPKVSPFSRIVISVSQTQQQGQQQKTHFVSFARAAAAASASAAAAAAAAAGEQKSTLSPSESVPQPLLVGVAKKGSCFDPANIKPVDSAISDAELEKPLDKGANALWQVRELGAFYASRSISFMMAFLRRVTADNEHNVRPMTYSDSVHKRHDFVNKNSAHLAHGFLVHALTHITANRNIYTTSALFPLGMVLSDLFITLKDTEGTHDKFSKQSIITTLEIASRLSFQHYRDSRPLITSGKLPLADVMRMRKQADPVLLVLARRFSSAVQHSSNPDNRLYLRALYIYLKNCRTPLTMPFFMRFISPTFKKAIDVIATIDIHDRNALDSLRFYIKIIRIATKHSNLTNQSIGYWLELFSPTAKLWTKLREFSVEAFRASAPHTSAATAAAATGGGGRALWGGGAQAQAQQNAIKKSVVQCVTTVFRGLINVANVLIKKFQLLDIPEEEGLWTAQDREHATLRRMVEERFGLLDFWVHPHTGFFSGDAVKEGEYIEGSLMHFYAHLSSCHLCPIVSNIELFRCYCSMAFAKFTRLFYSSHFTAKDAKLCRSLLKILINFAATHDPEAIKTMIDFGIFDLIRLEISLEYRAAFEWDSCDSRTPRFFTFKKLSQPSAKPAAGVSLAVPKIALPPEIVRHGPGKVNTSPGLQQGTSTTTTTTTTTSVPVPAPGKSGSSSHPSTSTTIKPDVKGRRLSSPALPKLRLKNLTPPPEAPASDSPPQHFQTHPHPILTLTKSDSDSDSDHAAERGSKTHEKSPLKKSKGKDKSKKVKLPLSSSPLLQNQLPADSPASDRRRSPSPESPSKSPSGLTHLPPKQLLSTHPKKHVPPLSLHTGLAGLMHVKEDDETTAARAGAFSPPMPPLPPPPPPPQPAKEEKKKRSKAAKSSKQRPVVPKLVVTNIARDLDATVSEDKITAFVGHMTKMEEVFQKNGKMQLQIHDHTQKPEYIMNDVNERSEEASKVEAHYLRERTRGAIYKNDDVHIDILLLLMVSLLDKTGCLSPLLCDQFPVQNGKPNILFILSQHLNHHANRGILPGLFLKCQKYGDNVKRLLFMTCSKFVDLGQYTDLKKIGAGAYGTIFSGYFNTKTATMRKVVLKEMPLEKNIFDRCVVHDAFTEVVALDTYKYDKRISTLYGYGMTTTCYMLSMKQYKCSLRAWRKRQTRPLSEMLPIYFAVYTDVLNVCSFLVENKINHYDLKCDNVFLDVLDQTTPESEFWSPSSALALPFYAVLGDFGEAALYRTEKDSYTTRNRGTEFIKSPEMLKVAYASDRTRNTYDRRRTAGCNASSDVWSIVCLLYELVTGEFLFYDDDWVRFFMRVTNPGVDLLSPANEEALRDYPDLLHFFQSTLVRDPVRRPTLTGIAILFDKLKQTMFPALFPPPPRGSGSSTYYTPAAMRTRCLCYQIRPPPYHAWQQDTTSSANLRDVNVPSIPAVLFSENFPDWWLERPTRILPFLFLGSMECAFDVRKLRSKFEVTDIVDVSGQDTRKLNELFRVIRLNPSRHSVAQFPYILETVVKFVRQALMHHGRTLILSESGKSLGPLIACACMIEFYKLDFYEAMLAMKKKRFMISPDPLLTAQVSIWGRCRTRLWGVADDDPLCWEIDPLMHFQCPCGHCSFHLNRKITNARVVTKEQASTSPPASLPGLLHKYFFVFHARDVPVASLRWSSVHPSDIRGFAETVQPKCVESLSNNWRYWECKICQTFISAVKNDSPDTMWILTSFPCTHQALFVDEYIVSCQNVQNEAFSHD